MFKKISLIISILFILVIIPANVSAKNVTLNDLIENGKKLDNKELTLQGEAIGESLSRGEYTWININDTTNAMGIYMKTTDSDKVTMYGSHKEQGDVLEVKGTFHRACKEHGGDMDIHAKKVTIVEKGKVKDDIISKSKASLAIGLSIVTIMLGFIAYKVLRKKE